jgi:hypothetical protein
MGATIVRIHEGGCLCNAVRYRTQGEPIRVTICHCRFCQRATGGAYMVEPIFRLEDVSITRGTPSIYTHSSEGSGKCLHIHSCSGCATKLYVTFERFPETCGVYGGTFDDPVWFPIEPTSARHIFIDAARPDTFLPAGILMFRQHALANDGTPRDPFLLDTPRAVGRPT